jgi:hypothetical protein
MFGRNVPSVFPLGRRVGFVIPQSVRDRRFEFIMLELF